MSIFDLFRVKKIKAELESVRNNYENLKLIMTPEHQEAFDLTTEIAKLSQKKDSLLSEIQKNNEQLDILNSQYEIKSKELLDLDEQISLESFALYEPKFEFANSTIFKQNLDNLRDEQKSMIKAGTACKGNQNWTVNNSKAEGRKMVNDMIKLSLRSFNNECDVCIANVKFNNISTYEKRINKSYEALNKLGKVTQVNITEEYLKLKLTELYLAYEYSVKKQEEKEEQRQIREQMREEARLQREIDEARKTIEKEKRHYTNALEKAMKQLDQCKSDEERLLLQEKIAELQNNLQEIEISLKDVDYREANQRAGYVYVISNIGSFGEGVFKIGMTRRLDPYDRVYELGDASVPFNFDVHAMIFSDDAPTLEATLHRTFEKKRLNFVNKRREYFNVSIDEIEQVIKNNHDKSIEFIRTAAAEEYRESILLRKQEDILSNNESLISWQEVAASKN
ncbi:DUF4041 domain-containing protein [Paenibacillus sp. An7]|uniref:DUF4041 domain-containing protein n=1 Tax=Paenibacillus sp. An7 TaxID=2689577 RepID=UPI00135C170E|nr:DUF4041 domain-containing protein [Paenibacillus sp. An7]